MLSHPSRTESHVVRKVKDTQHRSHTRFRNTSSGDFTIATLGSSRASSQDSRRHTEKLDITEIAGSRLYSQALELARKIAHKRDEEIKSDLRSTSRSRRSKETQGTRCELLYGLSREKQTHGKQRRAAIAQASTERRKLPDPDAFGVLPKSKATSMYEKGIELLRVKETRLAEAREKKRQIEEENAKFKLANGAFAYTEEPEFQRKVDCMRSRYLHYVETQAVFKEDRDDNSPECCTSENVTPLRAAEVVRDSQSSEEMIEQERVLELQEGTF